jgi:nucleoside-diphosphate-sugar epimerase
MTSPERIVRGLHFVEPVTLWGDGHQRREPVFVDDYVTWVADLGGKTANANLGEGDHSIREIAMRSATWSGSHSKRSSSIARGSWGPGQGSLALPGWTSYCRTAIGRGCRRASRA